MEEDLEAVDVEVSEEEDGEVAVLGEEADEFHGGEVGVALAGDEEEVEAEEGGEGGEEGLEDGFFLEEEDAEGGG